MTVLRIYDPSECDEHGVPLDWERCRTCGESGVESTYDGNTVGTCPVCIGHGSLKAAALHEMLWVGGPGGRFLPPKAPHPPRCEDCGHPMSEGTWEGGLSVPWAYVEAEMLKGQEPDFARHHRGVHFSPCDEGCRHGGPLRSRVNDGDWLVSDSVAKLFDGAEVPVMVAVTGGVECEASWRPVDVRTLGWPHDLRPERLAVLCLRCFAARNPNQEGGPDGR